MAQAFVFPGQGSQLVGMGKELATAFRSAREVFDEVDDALDQSLSKLIFDGPDDQLMLTQNTQPALMAVSMAVARVLKYEGGIDVGEHGAFVAGHSLGEYSALAAVGVFSLTDAARLLKVRGEAMQEAVPVGKGAMAAIFGLSPNDAIAIAKEAANGDVCDFANDNAPSQIVVSGCKAAVERAIELARNLGAKRTVILPVSAPFHCALMSPAADIMGSALAGVSMRDPSVPVVANISAQSVVDAVTARRLLVEQVTGRVRWRESIVYMKEAGVTTFTELGAGKVLSGLIRRIDSELITKSVATPWEVEAYLKAKF